MKFWMKTVAAAALCGFATLGMADSMAEAKTMLTAAQAELGSKGLSAADDFNAGGKWKGPKSYVVLVDFKGNMLAHSSNIKLVGKNLFEVKDAAGKPFVQETIKSVQATGESLIELRWSNPETKKIDNATFLARRVSGQDAYVGVAFFE